jgi:hypothetical protein
MMIKKEIKKNYRLLTDQVKYKQWEIHQQNLHYLMKNRDKK